MWTDYYLVFDGQTAFEACRGGLEAVGAAIDDIGALYREDTGETLAGYHVNVRLRDGLTMPAEALPYVIPRPAMPKRVFL